MFGPRKYRSFATRQEAEDFITTLHGQYFVPPQVREVLLHGGKIKYEVSY